MSELHAAILDDDGAVTGVIIVPADDADLGPAWDDHIKAKRVRRLTAAERDAGVGHGWRRAANGRLVDERPPPRPEPTPPPAPGKP